MEPIEQWKKEFIDINRHVYPPYMVYNEWRNAFNHEGTECQWQGFLQAKRSQPVVELPSEWFSNEDSPTPDLATWYRADLIHKRLTAAGIQYRIKGE